MSGWQVARVPGFVSSPIKSGCPGVRILGPGMALPPRLAYPAAISELFVDSDSVVELYGTHARLVVPLPG